MKKYKIVKKLKLAENVNEYEIYAPLVAKNARPGQFIILRVDEDGERIPFTICGYDKKKGTIKILVQTLGYSTLKLSLKEEGDSLQDFVGPLGKPTDLGDYKKILLVGGGIGIAVIYPQAALLNSLKKPADVIIGARTKELLMYDGPLEKEAKSLHIMTDDGSAGEQGFVTAKLEELLKENTYDVVMTVGPVMMMKAVCDITRKHKIKTIVSMNSIMVDGTGMCGCCRVSVSGETRYACVDGPEFDGHEVDFEEQQVRGSYYREQEHEDYCRLQAEVARREKENEKQK